MGCESPQLLWRLSTSALRGRVPEPTPRVRVEVHHRYVPRQRQHVPPWLVALLILAVLMWVSPFGAIIAGAILWVQENEYRPFWYYLEPDVRYFLSVSDIPSDARYFLLPEAAAPAFTADPRVADRHLHSLAPVVDGEKQRFEILGGR